MAHAWSLTCLHEVENNLSWEIAADSIDVKVPPTSHPVSTGAVSSGERMRSCKKILGAQETEGRE